MSQWTHVSVIIRFDALRPIDVDVMTLKDLGKTVRYDDDDYDDCTVPCGSEGSLHTSLWVNPESCSVPAYTATIWGDLRDYDDIQEIVAYLMRICEGREVRSGVAEINVEGTNIVVMRYENDAWGPV